MKPSVYASNNISDSEFETVNMVYIEYPYNGNIVSVRFERNNETGVVNVTFWDESNTKPIDYELELQTPVNEEDIYD
jgi:hypothetical protein